MVRLRSQPKVVGVFSLFLGSRGSFGRRRLPERLRAISDGFGKCIAFMVGALGAIGRRTELFPPFAQLDHGTASTLRCSKIGSS